MSTFFKQRAKLPTQGGVPSPGYFLEWAGLLMVVFLIAHVAGLREFTSVLNGTVGSTSLDWKTASLLGVVYVFLYLGVVLVVPILVLAALISKMWRRMTTTKGAADEPGKKAETN